MPSTPARLPKKQLTSAELAALQHDYENSGLSLRELGRRYNVAHTLVAYHVKARGWQRRMTELSQALTKKLVAQQMSRRDARTTSSRPLPANPKDQTEQLRHETEQPSPFAPLEQEPDQQPAGQIAGQVVAFPRGQPVGDVGPRPTPEEQLHAQVVMATLRAIATVEQLDAIACQERILAKLSRALLAYLNPLKVVATLPGSSEFGDEQREAAAEQVRAVALKTLVPTERDTFARTLQAFNRGSIELQRLKREVLGLGKTDPKAVLPEVDRAARDAAMAALPLEDLQAAYRVIKALDAAKKRSPPGMPMPPGSSSLHKP